jgi:hypothetical protein
LKSETYETIQGLGSWVAFLATGVTFPFALEYLGVVDVMSVDAYAEGRELMGSVVLISGAILATTLIAKLAMSWKEYRWYYRQEVAQKLHRLAEKIAKR